MKMDTNILSSYKNGNYDVLILQDGTKIRQTLSETFQPDFPESLDVKITNYCDLNCQFCHENSSINGKHCDMDFLIEVLSEYKPYVRHGIELAIGGGNPLSHPDLIYFLKKMNLMGFICNMTVNSHHSNNYILHKIIEDNLIYGLGISYNNESNAIIKNYPHTVSHLILGVHSFDDIINAYKLYNKILILGYKHVGRGRQFFNNKIKNNIKYISDNLWKILHSIDDGIISFDNLAIEQLFLKKYFSESAWSEFYMGNDGNFTLYVDAVNKTISRSSTEKNNYEYLSDISIIKYFRKQQKGVIND